MKMKCYLIFILSMLIGLIMSAAYPQGLDAVFKEARGGYRFISVDGDEGRYREDRYITDDHTGGIETLILSTSSNGISMDIGMHAIYDYDYGLDINLSKEDNFYIKFNGRQMRKYYDGSNEAWDPTLYSLTSEFADWEDGHIYADRINMDLEMGLTLPDMPQVALGWNRFGRDGQETLLRGARARVTGDTVPRLRSIPAMAHIHGWSDTFYVQLTDTIADKYNFMLKQEFETYDDDQHIIFPRYLNGAVEQYRTFQDDPRFKEWLTTFTFDSFLSEKVYVTANYLFQNLKNTTRREVIRPNLANPNTFIDPTVDNKRRANTVAIGAVFINPMIKDLQCGVNFRAERALTKAYGKGYAGGTTLRIAESENSETRYGESLTVAYKGLKKTILSFDLEAEQRDLDWNEYADTRSHEIFTNFNGPAELSREANIRFNDITGSLQITTKPLKYLKLTGRHKMAQKKRNYDELRDNSAAFYPGYLGSMDQDVNQSILKLSVGPFLRSWTAGAEFMHEENALGYSRQSADGQKLAINRLSANLMGNPCKNLILTFSGMAEDYELETPTSVVAGNDSEDGEAAYDYDGDVYVLSATGSYVFNKNISSYLTYQHTEVMGTVSNDLDEVWLGTKYRWNEEDALDVRLEYFDFDDEVGNGFDDYDGYTIYLGYEKKF